MRIGLYDPYLDTLSGGERYILKTAECLSNFHDVSIFWDSNLLSDAAKKFSLSLEKVQIKQNIFSPKISRIKRFLESSKYDLIIYLSDGSIPLIFSKKTILHFQAPITHVKFNIKTKIKLKRIYKIICNSYFTKSYIDSKFKCNSLVIYPPVSLLDSVQFSKKENIILTVGRYSEFYEGNDFKKINFMLDAFKKLPKNKLRGWKFIIVTNSLAEEKNGIEKLKDEIGEYPIEIKENISQDEINLLYSKAKIYWHAAGYQEDISQHPDRLEHFGISTVEAMSAGCIPVVYNAGGQKEIVKDGVNGFLWDTEEKLLSKTTEIIKSQSVANKIKIENKEIEDLYGENRFCKQINQII